VSPQRRRPPAPGSPTPEQRVEQALERLDGAYKELVSREHFMEAMRFAATQPNYSMNNVLLILAQHPTATHVMGYRAWQKAGRQVRKGEKGITIIAGLHRNVTVEDERTGEERKQKVFTNRYKPVPVFAQDQTEGREIPTVRPKQLEGDDIEPDAWAQLRQTIEDRGYRLVDEAPHLPGANGETDPRDRVVRVRPDMSGNQRFKTTAHEAAHIYAGHPDNLDQYAMHRGEAEVVAEAGAYIVCERVGLQSDPYTLPYLASWGNGDPEALRKLVKEAADVGRSLADRVSRELERDSSIDIDLDDSLEPVMEMS
jgi:antirestriction protein ArdC